MFNEKLFFNFSVVVTIRQKCSEVRVMIGCLSVLTRNLFSQKLNKSCANCPAGMSTYDVSIVLVVASVFVKLPNAAVTTKLSTLSAR
jgi:hypothetical protein